MRKYLPTINAVAPSCYLSWAAFIVVRVLALPRLLRKADVSLLDFEKQRVRAVLEITALVFHHFIPKSEVQKWIALLVAVRVAQR